MNKSDLAGVWKLEKFEITNEGEPTRPWGQDTRGLLIYTSGGHMSVAINRTGNSEADDILFYSGTYKVEKNQVIHEVLNASDKDRIGKPLTRDAQLNGDLLTLISRGDSFEAKIVWKKIE